MARPGVNAAVTSCELQAERCRAFIEQRSAAGWHFVQHFDDEGESGATLGRDGLIDLMLAAENGAIDQVVVHRVDRLSRNLSGFVHLLDFFTQLNVGLPEGREQRASAVPGATTVRRSILCSGPAESVSSGETSRRPVNQKGRLG